MSKGMTSGIFIILFVCALASCGPPIGYVGSSLVGSLDDFWTVPRRQVYDEGSSFIKADDLWVFASSRGIVQKIDVYQVTIEFEINPDDSNPAQIVPVPPNGAEFILLKSVVGVGRKLVRVSHNGMTAEYSIEIQDLTGGGGNGNGSDDSGFGEFIVWK